MLSLFTILLLNFLTFRQCGFCFLIYYYCQLYLTLYHNTSYTLARVLISTSFELSFMTIAITFPLLVFKNTIAVYLKIETPRSSTISQGGFIFTDLNILQWCCSTNSVFLHCWFLRRNLTSFTHFRTLATSGQLHLYKSDSHLPNDYQVLLNSTVSDYNVKPLTTTYAKNINCSFIFD